MQYLEKWDKKGAAKIAVPFFVCCAGGENVVQVGAEPREIEWRNKVWRNDASGVSALRRSSVWEPYPWCVTHPHPSAATAAGDHRVP